MGVIVKRNVILRAIVTPGLRQEIMNELDHAVEEVDQRIQQIDFSTKPYLTELQRTNLQQAIQVRKQIEAEKQKHEDLKVALEERRQQMISLQDNDEIVRGTLESWVEVAEGDNLSELLGGVEIVTKDDLVVEIRQSAPVNLDDLPPEVQQPARSSIITDLSGA
ncbi:MAG TPA: YlqD family protein [Armatimonadota bacterium]|jgi:hypothetical protein